MDFDLEYSAVQPEFQAFADRDPRPRQSIDLRPSSTLSRTTSTQRILAQDRATRVSATFRGS